MRPIMKLPKTGKGWVGLALVIIDLIIGCWPFILLFNNKSIFLGMPILMTWSIVIILFTTFTLLFLNKVEGVK